MAPQYIVAKYIPDLGRMEPKNIGVFVWSKGELRFKFLNPHDADFVNEPETFERWTAFWARRVEGDFVRPTRGKPVPKSDPACLEALLSTQKGNYALVAAGELMQNIRKKELDEVTNYLFGELVAPLKDRSKTEGSFKQQCNEMLRGLGISFKTKEPVECDWGGVVRHLHPDYYIGNGHPEAILQRATVSNERSVNSGAMLIHLLIEEGIIEQDKCRFLIRSTDIKSEAAEEGVAFCEKVCGIIDVENTDETTSLKKLVI